MEIALSGVEKRRRVPTPEPLTSVQRRNVARSHGGRSVLNHVQRERRSPSRNGARARLDVSSTAPFRERIISRGETDERRFRRMIQGAIERAESRIISSRSDRVASRRVTP